MILLSSAFQVEKLKILSRTSNFDNLVIHRSCNALASNFNSANNSDIIITRSTMGMIIVYLLYQHLSTKQVSFLGLLSDHLLALAQLYDVLNLFK